MDIGPGAKSAPVVAVLSHDQLTSMRRYRNSVSYHASRKDGDSPLSLDRELDDHTHELMSESCVWLSSRPGETPEQILGGNGWVAERDDELAGLMWHEDEEGGVTASEGTAMNPPSLPSRRSLGDVLGDHCLQDLIASSCEMEGIKPFQRRATVAPKTVPKYSPYRMRSQKAPSAAVPRHRAASDSYNSPLAVRRAGSLGTSRHQSKPPRSNLDGSPKSDGGPVPFEREQTRAVTAPKPQPSSVSNVMLQLSRELASRTLSGTLGGRSRSPDSRSTLSTYKPETRALLPLAPALRPTPWWERLAPKPLVRASSASSRRMSLVSASDMHCVAFRREVSQTNPTRRSQSHSHLPNHLRHSTPPPSQRGFTQASRSFRNEPSRGIVSPVRPPSLSRNQAMPLSSQPSLRRGVSSRDASFLRPTEASQSRRDAVALLPKVSSTVSSVNLSHGGNRHGITSSTPSTVSPPRATSAGRSSSQALFERLYTQRTEASFQHQHREEPPSPPPKPSTSKAAFVPSCATRKERSHLAKAYNLPEPPPRAVPQVRKYVPMAQRTQPKGSSPPPSRASVSPMASRRSPTQRQQNPALVSRGQVLYEQSRTAQMARKQEVIANAINGRRFEAPKSSTQENPARATTTFHGGPRTLTPHHTDPHVSALLRQASTLSNSQPGLRNPARCDLDSLFVSTPVYHRSLQENTHRPSPGTPRAQQGLSPYETAFEKPLAPIQGDISLVSVSMPEVMDIL